MHDVFKGIVVGFIGFVLWVLFSFFEGLGRAFGEASAVGSAGVYLGFLLMVGGPVMYILVVPVVNRLRGRR